MPKKGKLSKNAKRRAREKAKKVERRKQQENGKGKNDSTQLVPKDVTNTVEIEYVSADVSLELQKHDAFKVFEDVFSKFTKPEELTALPSSKSAAAKENKEGEGSNGDGSGGGELSSKSGSGKNDAGALAKPLSKKKRRLLNRLSVAELKQLVKRPDVVEVHDVTATDPRLLVYLKSYRNTVPVPRHWLLKRKYLQGKRGIEKPPFELPECIKITGIDKIREAFYEKEGALNSKAKARANMTGATGKTEVDYQVLYNAFFKYKTQPKNLTKHGDLYYESKEFETKLKGGTPGKLSDRLRGALGIPTRGGEGGSGAAADLVPPPWLINMQRYGPPPDYPKLKIPGLNAPLPEGASYGYNPGEWGKPPVDEYGQPLYGNVFSQQDSMAGEVDTKSRWGELADEDEDEDEESSDSDETEDESGDEAADAPSGISTPADLISGISSVTSGLETPGAIDLRKGRESVSSVGGAEPPKALYQVIGETSAKVDSSALFGSNRRYVMPTIGGSGNAAASAGGATDTSSIRDVQVALDPSEIAGLTQEELQKKYESQDAPSSKATLDAITNKRKRKMANSDSIASKRAPSSDYKR